MDTQESVRSGLHSCPPVLAYAYSVLIKMGATCATGHRIRQSSCVYTGGFLMLSCSRQNSDLLTFGGRYMSKTDHVTNTTLAHGLDEPNSAELFTSMVLASFMDTLAIGAH
jgi:hypothetical protein